MAVVYMRATGEKRFLEIRPEDYGSGWQNTFGVKRENAWGMPGHQKRAGSCRNLYEETGKESYKELAKYFIGCTAVGNRNYFLEEMKQSRRKNVFFRSLTTGRPEYSQSHLPVRKQRTAGRT